MKSQKGEKGRRMKQRLISMEGINEHESRWRLLVFGVPHIHWRRIQVFFWQSPNTDLSLVLIWIRVSYFSKEVLI